MNDAKSMLMMYSYAAMKANEAKAEEKATTKVTTEAKAEAKAKADKDTKRRGKKNDEGTERADSTITKK